MQYRKKMENMLSSKDSTLIFDEETVCPICKHGISPIYISSTLNSEHSATVFNYCRACNSSFISNYAISKSGESSSSYYYYNSELLSSEPNKYSKQVFDEGIINISAQFEKIYNQALAAESNGLDEIAGLGYRKSLEFLIKDFAIHLNPDDEETIKVNWFKKVIDDYIPDTTIKLLVERSTWIGNDEAHYLRKQTDRDVSDMKKFIQAIVYYIGMFLITEDAKSMTPQ